MATSSNCSHSITQGPPLTSHVSKAIRRTGDLGTEGRKRNAFKFPKTYKIKGQLVNLFNNGQRLLKLNRLNIIWSNRHSFPASDSCFEPRKTWIPKDGPLTIGKKHLPPKVTSSLEFRRHCLRKCEYSSSSGWMEFVSHQFHARNFPLSHVGVLEIQTFLLGATSLSNVGLTILRSSKIF